MKNQGLHLRCALALLLLLTIHHPLGSTFAQGTAFTYQGRLYDGTNPANGNYDLRFAICDALTAGMQQGSLVTNSATVVSNGLFTVTLDFGNQFPGANRWLEISVRTNNAATFFTLSPRQALTPAPYAVTAGNVISGGLAAGAYGSAVSFNNGNNNFSGSFSGNGANVTNVNAATLGGLTSSNFWRTSGNAGTAPGANFVGTTDNQPLELRANGQRALRLEPVVNGTSFSNDVNVIGGSSVNFAAPGVSGATISGGGAGSYFGAPLTNSTASDFTAIGGGASITIQTNASYSTIGGGHLNAIQNLATESTIGGGANNTIQINANDSSISGGDLNLIQTNSAQSTIGGGYNNVIQPLAAYATIGGGGVNTIQNGAYGATIGAGYNNTIQASAIESVIGGGLNNNISSNSSVSTLAGGQRNVVGASTFAAAIGGGSANRIGFAVTCPTISGGESNMISVGDDHATIAGGLQNTIANFASYATISGGLQNTNGGTVSTIAGGANNYIPYDPFGYSVIGGGFLNTCASNAVVAGGDENAAYGYVSVIGGGIYNEATGSYAVVPGGEYNLAEGDNSFAAGIGAYALHANSFVWSDGSVLATSLSTTAPGQFLITASGGVGIGTNAPSAQLHVVSDKGSPEIQITQQNPADYSRLRMNVAGYPSWEVDVSPGTTPQLQFWNSTERAYIDYSGNVYATSFNPSSDRNLKENFASVSPREVLDKVAALPITRWNFKQDKSSEHLGPMAQDFKAAFGLGTDDKHIGLVDEGGVALAAIQGLNQKVEEKDAKIRQQSAEIADLQMRLDKLEQLLTGKPTGAK